MSSRAKALRMDALIQRHVPRFRRQILKEKNRYIDAQVSYYGLRGALSDTLESEHMANMMAIFRQNFKILMPAVYNLSVEITGSKKSRDAMEYKADAFLVFLMEWVRQYGAVRAQETAKTTTDDLKRIISKAFENEDPAPVIIKKALKAKGLSAFRADTIARTETHQAAMYAHKRQIENYAAQAASLGVTVKKQWSSVADERTRPWHTDMDGETVGLNEYFIVDGEKMDRPGDPDASAHNTINCRCVLVTVDDF